MSYRVEELMAIARDAQRDPISRLAAYRDAEAERWLQAHNERGMPINQIPIEYRERVCDLIKARVLRPFVSRKDPEC